MVRPFRLTYVPDVGHFSAERCFDSAIMLVVLVTRVSLIIADVLVLVLTWIKTYKQVVEGRRAGITTSISMCLLRDGSSFLSLFGITLLRPTKALFTSCKLLT